MGSRFRWGILGLGGGEFGEIALRELARWTDLDRCLGFVSVAALQKIA